jgi:hypothetical protein
MTVRARAASLVATALCVLPFAGCVTGNYGHRSFNEPVSTERLEALEPGKDDLTTCLAALGAPNRVFEYQVGPDLTSGMALLWFWRDSEGFGVEVSAPVEDASMNFQYDQTDTELPGCALWFSSDLRLERWRLGRVGDLLPGRVRPAPAVD